MGISLLKLVSSLLKPVKLRYCSISSDTDKLNNAIKDPEAVTCIYGTKIYN
jgi:hypothetical protein